MESFKNPINISNIREKKVLPGILRKTLVYGKKGTMCFFNLKKGSKLPLHNHSQVQMGYVLSGSLEFFTKKGTFLARAGDSYYFRSDEKHGANVKENAEVLDIFIPLREDYLPEEQDYIPSKEHFIP